MATSKMSSHAQLKIGSLIRKGGREDFAGFDVHSDPVDDGPVEIPPENGVQLADAGLRQIDLQWVFVERFCNGKNRGVLSSKVSPTWNKLLCT